MADTAHYQTDQKLEEMEKRLSAIYSRAEKEIEKRSNMNLDSKTANAGKMNYTKYARDLDNITGFYNGKKQGFAWCAGC